MLPPCPVPADTPRMARRPMAGNQANHLGRAFLALRRARAPLPWSARPTSPAVAPCPAPAQRPAHTAQSPWAPEPPSVHSLLTDLPSPPSPNTKLPSPGSPHRALLEARQAHQTGKRPENSCWGGGQGWGAWGRPGGRGVSDKGALCCANFFQDVKGVTIDNPDWCVCGGGVKDTGVWWRGCGLESQSAFQGAEDEGTDLPPLPVSP